MMEKKVPYLAGCVFYLLLRKAGYEGITARQRKDGIKDNHKNPTFMADLVYTFTGYQTVGSSSDTSNYREGKSEGTVNVPFHDTSSIASYDNVVRSRYPDALTRMVEFVEWHLNPDKREWLVKALLDVIENDDDILGTDEFCIRSTGTFVQKKNLRNEDVFEYQPFLVGVLHYILTKRAGKNYLGIPTLDANTEKVKSKERQYNGHLGEKLGYRVTVNPYKKAEIEETQETRSVAENKDETIFELDGIIDKSDDEVINEAILRTSKVMASTMGAVEKTFEFSDIQKENVVKGVSVLASALEANKHALAEKIRENSRKEESASQTEIPGAEEAAAKGTPEDKKTTIIQQQTNVIQNGDSNVNVTNNGTINFNFQGGSQ